MTTIESTRLPSFFVVGAQKAGTTTLHTWLAGEPEICLPEIKETHFFRDEEKFSEGVESYLQWFRPGKDERVLGEVDPEYMFFPEIPGRIRSMIAKPRIVFVLRDPLARAFSHYRMSVRRGFEELDFPAALQAEERRLSSGDSHSWIHHSYLARGRYAEQISRYRATFGGDDLMAVRFEDLFSESSAQRTYAEIRDFIGLTGPADEVHPTRAANAASDTRFEWLRRLIYVRTPARARIGALIPSRRLKLKLALLADRFNRKQAAPAPEDWMDGVPVQVRERVNREIRELQESTGLDLDRWICPVD